MMPKTNSVILHSTQVELSTAFEVFKVQPINWDVSATAKGHLDALNAAKKAALTSIPAANADLSTSIRDAYDHQIQETQALYKQLEQKVALIGTSNNITQKNLNLEKLNVDFEAELKELHERHLAGIDKLYTDTSDVTLKSAQHAAQEKLYEAQKKQIEDDINKAIAYQTMLGDRFIGNTLALATLKHSDEHPSSDMNVTIKNRDADAKLSENTTYKTTYGKEIKIENGAATATYKVFERNFGSPEKLRSNIRDQIAAAIALGKSQGKDGIDISCTHTKGWFEGKKSKQMGSLCWQEAVKMGVPPEKITGYVPTAEDKAWYKQVVAAQTKTLANLQNTSALSYVNTLQANNACLNRIIGEADKDLQRLHNALNVAPPATTTIPTLDEMQKLVTNLEELSNGIEKQLQNLAQLKSMIKDPTPAQHQLINELADELSANMNKLLDHVKDPTVQEQYQELFTAGKQQASSKLDDAQKAAPNPNSQHAITQAQETVAEWKLLQSKLTDITKTCTTQAAKLPQPGQFLPPGPLPAQKP